MKILLSPSIPKIHPLVQNLKMLSLVEVDGRKIDPAESLEKVFPTKRERIYFDLFYSQVNDINPKEREDFLLAPSEPC